MLAGAVLAPVLALAVTSSVHRDADVPRYAHVFVIIDENKDYAAILNAAYAPNIASLAKRYGNATAFYAEVHPSEGNYVALVGGNTFGIHDDDAYYCTPGMKNVHCEKSTRPGYVDHTVRAPSLASQLERAGVPWKAYYESLPQPGSGAVVAGDPKFAPNAGVWELYASKHSGFMNFADVQHDPARAQRMVGFDQLFSDLSSGQLPAFALIVPNQCNDMHGLDPTDYTGPAANVPTDCNHHNQQGLIRRGDTMIAKLVSAIMQSSAWRSNGNAAIVLTFDEAGSDAPGGCCGIQPGSLANFGGGHIPTLVITNHGPRGLSDATPYSHYSLLRTIEDAFGITNHLGHAADTNAGVQPMVPLFRTH
jgi:hypothetical protein